jgi:hypothetical protein
VALFTVGDSWFHKIPRDRARAPSRCSISEMQLENNDTEMENNRFRSDVEKIVEEKLKSYEEDMKLFTTIEYHGISDKDLQNVDFSQCILA